MTNLPNGLRAYRNGGLVFEARIAGQQLNLVTPAAPGTTFDRLVLTLSASDGKGAQIVIDAVPSPGGPSASNDGTWLKSTVVAGQGSRIDLICQLRVLVSSRQPAFVTLRANLTDIGGTLQFEKISYGYVAVTTTVPVSPLDVTVLQQQVPLPQLFKAWLFEVLGLTAKTLFASNVQLQLAQVGNSRLWVPSITRVLVLEDEDQTLRVPGLNIAWGEDEIAAEKLNVESKTPGSVEQRLWIDEDTDLSVAPSARQCGRWIVSIQGLPSGGIVRAWNTSIVRPYLESLRTVQDGSPLSALPMLLPATTTQGRLWTVELLALDCTTGPQDLVIDDIVLSATPVAQRVAVGCRSVQPFVNKSPDNSSNWSLQVTASLPGFLNQAGRPLEFDANVLPLQKGVDTAGFAFDLRHRAPQQVRTNPDLPAYRQMLQVRLGSLDLEFLPADAALQELNLPEKDLKRLDDRDLLSPYVVSTVSADLRSARLLDEGKTCIPTISIDLSLPASRFLPGDQDDPPSEEFATLGPSGANETVSNQAISSRFQRESPVLILNWKDWAPGDQPAPFVVRFIEQTQPWRSQVINIRLELNSQSPISSNANRGAKSVIVLDRSPLLIAQVGVPNLGVQASSQGLRELGNWTSDATDGASWRLRGSQSGFDLLLPPQGLGEAMEKVKGPPETEKVKNPPPGMDPGFADIDEGEPADFRFTPIARFKLKPSFFDQRFAEAPWNLRRQFGFPGERAPGAEVFQARFELLYGMRCNVAQPGLRLAEIAALEGTLPGELALTLPWTAMELAAGTPAQRQVYLNLRDSWSTTFGRLATRLGILEPWQDPHGEQLLITQSEVTNGPPTLSYSLRETARLAYPTGEFNRPVPSKAPKSQGGLAGGVAWGFEFNSVYEELWGNPLSTHGELARPYFSALGGWGFQKAKFSNDKTTIYSDTAMGRTFFYSIERIGRIGVFWNRAKHVIVYERTVACEERFLQGQDLLQGRPVLRKVKEYVEILVPIVKFADNGSSDDKRARGCVLGDEFKTLRMNVDSAWGSDVVDTDGKTLIGYQIPLWRHGLEPRDFPKPHVLLELAADPQSGQPSFKSELEDPDKLVFFSSTRPGDTADTDAWASAPGIDYVNAQVPRAPKLPPLNRNDLDGMLADAGALEAGYEDLTFHVAESAQMANLAVDRATSVLSTKVRNVTMSRSSPSTSTPLAGALGQIANVPCIIDHLNTLLLSQLPQTLANVNPADVRAQLMNAFAEYKSIVSGTAATSIDGTLPRSNVTITLNTADPIKKLAVGDYLVLEPGTNSEEWCVVSQSDVDARQVTLASVLLKHTGPSFTLEAHGQPIALAQAAAKFAQSALPTKTRDYGALADLKAYHAARQDAWRTRIGQQVDKSFDPKLSVGKSFAQLDDQVNSILRTVKDTDNAKAALKVAVSAGLNDVLSQVQPVETGLQELVALRAALQKGVTLVNQFKTRLGGELTQILDQFQGLLAQAQLDLASTQQQASALIDSLEQDLNAFETETETRLAGIVQTLFGNAPSCRNRLAEISKAISKGCGDLKTKVQNFTDLSKLETAIAPGGTVDQAVRTFLITTLANLTDPVVALLNSAASGGDSLGKLGDKIDGFVNAITSTIDESAQGPILAAIGTAAGEVPAIVNAVQAQIAGAKKNLISAIDSQFALAAGYVTSDASNWLPSALNPGALSTQITNWSSQVNAAVSGFTDIASFQQALAAAAQSAQAALALESQRVNDALHQVLPQANGALQVADSTLRLLRAWGDAPKVPTMGFNRNRLAYYFDSLNPAVDLTPVSAFVDRIGDELKPMGLRLPTSQILEGLIADNLPDFNLSDLLPDFSGIKLDNLFNGVMAPGNLAKYVTIKHGFDQQALRAWLNATLHFQFPDPTEVFSFGPLTLTVLNADFQAESDFKGQLGAGIQKTVTAALTADWDLTVAGFDIVTLVQTQLLFDAAGKMKFNISPEKIRLNGVLDFLSKLMDYAGAGGDDDDDDDDSDDDDSDDDDSDDDDSDDSDDSDDDDDGDGGVQSGGFSYHVIEKNGLPTGVEARLDLPIPPVQFGTFGISNLRIGTSFSLEVDDDFVIATSFDLATKTSPFTLTVYVLGGAGFVNVRARYFPISGRLVTSVSIGLFASASLAFSFGPLNGSVAIYFGIAAEFDHEGNGAGDGLTVAIVIIVRGQVNVMGIVTACLQLMLEVAYNGSTGSLIGHGTVDLSIKICWCFTIHVSQSVTYTFAQGSKNAATPLPNKAQYAAAATSQRNSFC